MSATLILAALLPLVAAQAAPADEGAKAVAPLVGPEVAIVVQVDLDRVDIDRAVKALLGEKVDQKELGIEEPRRMVAEWVAALRKAGATRFYVLVDPADLPGLPLAVVPLTTGADPAAIGKVLTEGGPAKPLTWPAVATIRGAVVAGTPEALDRVRAAKPSERPEVATALAAGGDAPLRVTLVPSDTLRRSMEESVPELPQPLGGGPITSLSRGLKWAAFGLAIEPKPTVRMVAQGTDAASAQTLQKLVSTLFEEIKRGAPKTPEAQLLIQALAAMKPEVKGDRVEITADLSQATQLVSGPVVAAREAARRSQCINNLKQIGLAMHNFHDVNGSFPAAAITDKAGKPLLSWRVAILPFIEQQALYNQFHLDEPWDSEHNKKLITTIPRTYMCPSGSAELFREGKTPYLAPRGDSAMFPGLKGTKLQEITDGTSNTILIVEGNDEAAVPWTKPDDWEVGAAPSLKALAGHHPGGINVLFGDGSVRFLRETIDAKMIKALFTRNGGEVIGGDGF